MRLYLVATPDGLRAALAERILVADGDLILVDQGGDVCGYFKSHHWMSAWLLDEAPDDLEDDKDASEVGGERNG